MNNEAQIADIQEYKHLLVGGEASVCLDDTSYQSMVNDVLTSLFSGRNNKPGATDPDVSAWNDLGIIDDFKLGEGNKTEIKLKRATKGGVVKTVKKVVVEAEDTITIDLSSVPKEVMSIAFGVKITTTGSYKPFSVRTFNGWIKLQALDEAEQLRIGFDLYCNFTVDAYTCKADEFTKVVLKCTVLDTQKDVVYVTV